MYASNICRVHQNNGWDSCIKYLLDVGLILGGMIVVLSWVLMELHANKIKIHIVCNKKFQQASFELSGRMSIMMERCLANMCWSEDRDMTKQLLFRILIPTKYIMSMELNDVQQIQTTNNIMDGGAPRQRQCQVNIFTIFNTFNVHIREHNNASFRCMFLAS